MLSCLGLQGHHTPHDKHLQLRPFQTSRNFTKQSEGNIQWAAGEQVCEVTCRPPCMKDDWGFVSVYRIFEKWSDILENLGFKLNMYQCFVLHDLSIYPPQNICVGRTSSSGGPAPSGLVQNKRTSRLLGESSLHLRCFTFFMFLLFRSSFGSNSTI